MIVVAAAARDVERPGVVTAPGGEEPDDIDRRTIGPLVVRIGEYVVRTPIVVDERDPAAAGDGDFLRRDTRGGDGDLRGE